jgi:hypothetical protein
MTEIPRRTKFRIKNLIIAVSCVFLAIVCDWLAIRFYITADDAFSKALGIFIFASATIILIILVIFIAVDIRQGK